MAEMFKSRAIFKAGKQKLFLNQVYENLGVSWKEIAKIIKVSQRTLIDWKREKFSMTVKAAHFLSKKAEISLPKFKVEDPFWYVYKGAKIGGLVVFKKYGKIGGDDEYRKKKWKEWWEKKGKFKRNSILNNPLKINKPKRSKELAEFVGIVLGDGGISKYQVTITLHHINDKEYCIYISSLIKKLFNVELNIRHDEKKSVNIIVMSRIELVNFLTKNLGLKKGNKIKQQIDIPNWIKKNKKFQIACVRGLVDTDGSVFTHKYRLRNKIYSYKKMDFCSASIPLKQSVFNILKSLGLNAKINGNKVCLNSIKDLNNYFSIINSHNPKHLKRYWK